MRVTVRFFAGSREAAGCEEVHVELPAEATVADLEAVLMERYPGLAPYAGRVRYAVNWDYVDRSYLLCAEDEVALIPPVAGGTEGRFLVRITSEPISEADVRPFVEVPEAGAIVLFLGVVRNHAEGRAVRGLEYQAYEPMAQRVLEHLVRETAAKWDLHRVAVVHRVGRLEIGAVSIAIAVSAAHRREAFAACAHLMDRIKEEVPIWKREFWADGAARWVNDPVEESVTQEVEGER